MPAIRMSRSDALAMVIAYRSNICVMELRIAKMGKLFAANEFL